MEKLSKYNVILIFLSRELEGTLNEKFSPFPRFALEVESSLLINLWFIHFYLKDPRIYLICVNGRPRFEDDVDDRDRDHEHNCDLKMSIIIIIIMITEMIIILFYRDDYYIILQRWLHRWLLYFSFLPDFSLVVPTTILMTSLSPVSGLLIFLFQKYANKMCYKFNSPFPPRRPPQLFYYR